MTGQIRFFYEFASTYSYLSAMRISELAAERGRVVEWVPFMLGPVFHERGWNTSPFNIYPDKGRYMWRDMERLTQAAGIALVRPDPFPQHSLLAARLAVVGRRHGWVEAFSRAVFVAEFGEGKDISQPPVLEAILKTVTSDADAAMQAAGEPAVKQQLRDNGDQAAQCGVFGAPSFVTADGELFWGNDRLEAALDWRGSDV